MNSSLETGEVASSSGRGWGGWQARDLAPLASLAALVVFFSLATPQFLQMSTLTAILKQGAVLAIVSAGLTFVLLCAEIDLAVGMTALWAACFCGWLTERWASAPGGSLDPLAAAATLALPLGSCLVMGFLSGVLTVWSRLPSFIVSLAMMFIAEGSARYLTKGQILPVPQLLQTLGNRGFRLGETLLLPYSALLAAAVMLLGHLVLQHTRFGRYVYMTGGNREAARLSGVRTGRVVVACLVICAVTAGIGGLVNAGRLTKVSSDQNKDLLLSAVACVVLGGTSLFGGEGSMGRTVIGVLTFTVLNVGLMQIRWIEDLARQLLTGAVLVAALLVNGGLSEPGPRLSLRTNFRRLLRGLRRARSPAKHIQTTEAQPPKPEELLEQRTKTE